MHRRGGPNVAIAFGPGGPLTAQLRAVESPGGPVSGGDRRKRDRACIGTVCFIWKSIPDSATKFNL